MYGRKGLHDRFKGASEGYILFIWKRVVRPKSLCISNRITSALILVPKQKATSATRTDNQMNLCVVGKSLEPISSLFYLYLVYIGPRH